MEIIGLSGKAGAGKDFVAKRVLRPLGYQNVALAWPLKMRVMREQYLTFNEVFVEKGPRTRELLQLVGVEERKRDENHWVRQLDQLITVLNREGGIEKFVITDVRFPNEADYVKSRGGKLVRVEHAGRVYPLAGTEAAEHESETALDGLPGIWDCVLQNGPSASVLDLHMALEDAGVIPVTGERWHSGGPDQLELWR